MLGPRYSSTNEVPTFHAESHLHEAIRPLTGITVL